MGIALLTVSSLFQGLSFVQRAVAPTARQALLAEARSADRARVFSSNRPARAHSACFRSAAASPLAARSARPAAVTPLRVVRLSESGERTGSAGRMVISGRMADVCAELDRLAAREAATLSH
jgi:hypothetical protein